MLPEPRPLPRNGSVREATVGDAAAIARALVEAWRAAYVGIIDAGFLEAMDAGPLAGRWALTLAGKTAARPLVATAGGDVVGFCHFGVPRDAAAPGSGELYALNLLPACWGRGLGGLLLRAATAALEGQGCTQAYLWVAHGNRRAIDLYRRHGWFDTGATKEDARFTPPLLEHRYAIDLA